MTNPIARIAIGRIDFFIRKDFMKTAFSFIFFLPTYFFYYLE
jgi:hypothetical protein